MLRIWRSKADQAGAGRVLGVHRGKHRATCPVVVLERWILERGDVAGPLFCRLRKPGDGVQPHKRMTGEAVGDLEHVPTQRLQVDLGSAIEIKQVNTYSWHAKERGPQVYALFGSDGTDAGFDFDAGDNNGVFVG